MNPCIPHLKWRCAPHLYHYHLKSEVSIMLCCQLCSTCYTAFRIKNCSESTSTIYAYSTKRNGATHPNFINYHLKSEVSITLHCWLCSTCYTAIQIKNCLKSTSAIKTATMKNMDDFHFEGRPSCVTAKLTPFPVSKDEWDTKEDTGKSMKNALYVLWHAKRHLSG